MDFEWDTNKALDNIKKHDGITSEEASLTFFDEWAIEEYDDAHSDDMERRFILIGLAGDRLLRVTYTAREKIRIISAEKARPYEERAYNKNRMSMTNEKVIEVEVTAEDITKMRADGVSEADLPEIGMKRFRPAHHILKDKIAILLDVDIVEHFKKRAESDDTEFYQTQINQTLRRMIENEK